DTEGIAREHVGIERALAEGELTAVVICIDADEYAASTSTQALRRNGRVLERFPAQFEQQPLLRVHAFGFASGDSKEPCIEIVDRDIQEGCGADIHFARGIRVGVIEGLDVPAVGRYLC